ncbi:MAG: DUF1254 domain-containing protein [Nitrososphaeraceae archaeon]
MNGLRTFVSSLIVIAIIVAGTIPIQSSVFAQTQTNATSSNVTASSSQSQIEELNKKMAELKSSNKPEDIATLAYIWGYPLVLSELTKEYVTSPNVPPGPGRGPINTMNHFTKAANASFTDVVRPPVDFLLSTAWLDLKDGPLVLQIPNVSHRYFSVQFLDAYSNVLGYVGTRASDGKGGTFLLAGPDGNATLPGNNTSKNMKTIQSPTNINWVIVRTLIEGPKDVENVHKIQNSINLTSVYQNISSASSQEGTTIPIAPLAENIPKLGTGFFDILSKSLLNNPAPENQTSLIAKFQTIGIGKIPSKDLSNNQTLVQALKTGISEGEKLIDRKVGNLGTVINGWAVSYDIGAYGEDYLLRAAIAKAGFGSNIAEEAITPLTAVDGKGNQLNGANDNNYIIHFEKGQLPPVKPGGFWSITIYDNKGFLVDNPLNRYVISEETEGLKTGNDGSLDIYLSSKNPGPDKESNWLPIPETNFNLVLLIYIPEESVIKGEYNPPPVELTNATA